MMKAIFISVWMMAIGSISFLIIMFNAFMSPTKATLVKFDVFGEAWIEMVLLFPAVLMSTVAGMFLSLRAFWNDKSPAVVP